MRCLRFAFLAHLQIPVDNQVAEKMPLDRNPLQRWNDAHVGSQASHDRSHIEQIAAIVGIQIQTSTNQCKCKAIGNNKPVSHACAVQGFERMAWSSQNQLTVSD